MMNWRQFPEPVQLMYALMLTIVIIPKDKIYIDKVCKINLKEFLAERNLTTDVCDIMTGDESLDFVEEETQRQVSQLKVYEGLILNLPSMLFALVAGSLADTVGRKIFMTIPFIGGIVSSVWLMITVIWWDSFPPEYLLLAGIEGCFGGYMCMNLGLYSYIADTTSDLDRTFRMSFLTGIFNVSYLLGAQIGGRVENYIIIFGMTAGIGVLGVIYSTFILQESLPKPNEEKGVLEEPKKSMFSILWDSFGALVKARPGNARILGLLAFLQFMTFMLCVNTLEYDYLMTRIKFDWERDDYGNYLTVQRVARLTGLFVLLPLISRLFKIADEIIIFLCCLITFLSYIILTVSSPSWSNQTCSPEGCNSLQEMVRSWPVFLAAITQMIPVATSTLRSVLSKVFGANDLGKVYALIGIGQALVALLAHSLLGVIYKATLDYYPTMYLIPVNIMLLIATLTSLFAARLNKTTEVKDLSTSKP